METISVGITDSFDVQCFDLYPINIFTKSAKAERCTDITIKLTFYYLSVTFEDPKFIMKIDMINILGTRYFVLFDAASGARQVHDTSVRLIFPALHLTGITG